MDGSMTSYFCNVVATIEAASNIVSEIEDVLHQNKSVSSSMLNAVIVCIHELIGNVVLYSKLATGSVSLRVELKIEGERLSVLIKDNGDAFDPSKYVTYNCDSDLASAAIGGRGIRIVRELSQSLLYERIGDWNFVYLEFK